jgi:hypothetical protein
MVETAARGSISTCEALSSPLSLIPGVGSTVAIVMDWACLIPGVFAVEYTEAHHGQRHHFYWQPAISLVLARGFRDLIEYPAIALAITVGVLYALGALPVVVMAPYFTPVAVAGLLTLSGVGYVVFKKVRDKGSDLVFELSYHLLAPEHEDPVERDRAAAESLLQPPLTSVTRAWALAATAAGAEPRWSPMFWIPVAGAWIKASARGEAIKATMRRTAADVLDEDQADLSAVDATTDVLTGAEGVFGVAGQALLIGGGALFVTGAVFAGLQYQETEDLGSYAAIATTTGITGAALAGTGLGLILLREVPEVLRPIAIPIAYGLFPPEQAETDPALPSPARGE